MEPKIKEHRAHTRIDFTGDVTYEASLFSGDEETVMLKTGEGSAVNVSERGLCLVTKDNMKEGQILKVNLPMPHIPVQAPTLAMVRWVRPYNDGYKVGMMFMI